MNLKSSLKSLSFSPFDNFPLLTKIFGLSLIYGFVYWAVLALMIENGSGQASHFFLASGIALAAVLIGGNQYFLAIFLGGTGANLVLHNSLSVGLITSFGSALAAVFAALMIRRDKNFNPALRVSLRDGVEVLVWGVTSAGVAAVIGALTFQFVGGASQANLFNNASAWWMGDAIGIVILTPLILSWWAVWVGGQARLVVTSIFELFAISLVTVLASGIIFLDWGHDEVLTHYGFQLDLLANAYLLFALIAWAAMRIGLRGTCLVVLLVSLMGFWGTVQGIGYFGVENYVVHENAVPLANYHAAFTAYWLFIFIFSLVGLLLATQIEAMRMLQNNLKLSQASLLESRRDIEKKLRENQTIFYSMIDNLPFATWYKDEDCRWLAANQTLINTLGDRDPATIWGAHNCDLFPADLAEKYEADDRAVMASRQEVVTEEGYELDGQRRWIETYKKPVIDVSGRLLGTVGYFRDITEVREKTALMKLLEASMAHSNDLVMITEAEPLSFPGPRIIYVNDAFERETGYTKAEAIGNTPRMLQGVRSDRATMDRVHEKLSRWEPVRETVLNYTKTGEEFWQELNITPVVDKTGWVTHWVSIQRNVTAQKQAQEILRASQRDLEDAQRIARIGFYTTDFLTGISSATDVVHEIFGDKETFHKAVKQWQELMLFGQEKNNTDYGVELEVGGGKFKKEYPIFRKNDGQVRWVSVLAECVFDANNSPVLCRGTIQDITERKVIEMELAEHRDQLNDLVNDKTAELRAALELNTEALHELEKRNKDLRKAEAAATAASRAKSEFLANMSHEIRTPMNAVMGMSHLVLNTELDEKQRDYVNKINVGASSLLRIINDILDFSKIDAGKLELEYAPFEVKSLMQHLSLMVSETRRDKSVDFVIKVAAAVPNILEGDFLRLGQILINLVNNAIKFTEIGQVVLKVEVIATNRQKVHLKFSVQDSGIGMSAEQLGRLFGAFSQADNSVTRKYGGTGLGLAISKNLVGLMGGQLKVNSELGVGSTFEFSLWMDVPVQQITEKESEESSEGYNLQNVSVLIAEDNRVNQQIVMGLLAEKGVVVTLANNGQEVLDLLAAAPTPLPWSLVLMDIQMPVLDGHLATIQIRSNDRYVDLPVIAMTAHAMKEERDRCYAEGMVDYVTKPIDPAALYRCIKRWSGR